MRDLSTFTTLHKNQLRDELPFIWLFEIEPVSAAERYRMTNFTELIRFGQGGDPPTDILYYPAPIVHSGVNESSDGSLPTIEITVGTASMEVSNAVEDNDGFVGQPARIILVSARELGTPENALYFDGQIVNAAINPGTVTLTFSAYNLWRAKFPPNAFSKFRCRHVPFGGAACGYNINAPGAGFTACGYTLEDCIERGDDEESNLGAEFRQHPERFGGFPGIPRAART